jgi:hypothetical protein
MRSEPAWELDTAAQELLFSNIGAIVILALFSISFSVSNKSVPIGLHLMLFF